MLTAIQFNNRLRGRASKIDDVIADRMLTAEFPGWCRLANSMPEDFFGAGAILAQPPGETSYEDLSPSAAPPHPTSPPQGGEEPLGDRTREVTLRPNTNDDTALRRSQMTRPSNIQIAGELGVFGDVGVAQFGLSSHQLLHQRAARHIVRRHTQQGPRGGVHGG